MAFGPFNTGGGGAATAAKVRYNNQASGLDAQNAQAALDELWSMIDAFKAEIISGEICADLTTSDGDELLESSSGEQLVVCRKLDTSEAINASASAALTSAIGNIAAKLRSETAAAIAAHNTSGSSHAGYLAVSQ